MGWGLRAAVFLLAGAQVAGFGQAVHPVFDSVAHFRLHLAVALGLASGLVMLVRAPRFAAAGMVVAAASLASLAPAVPNADAAVGRPDLVLVQYNSLFRNPTPREIAVQIRAADADVVTLQEVSRKTTEILQELEPDYPYQVVCPFRTVGGVAVLSRTPAVQQGCAEGEGFAWLRTEIRGRAVTMASLHLHWPFPYEQSGQIDRLAEAFSALPQPTILGGDFNAAPWSHNVARVAKATGTRVAGGLRLSWQVGLPGIGRIPMLPIDQVLVPPDVTAVSAALGAMAGSDHLPVIARLAFGD